MSNKKQIRKIKANIERTIQGLYTKPQEFIYEQTGGFVRPGMVYSVYYTLSKKEVYLTGITDTSNSKVIKRTKGRTMFSTYSNLKSLTRQEYPEITPVNPSESDYRIGRITRYFTQKANDRNADTFEVSKEDFNKKNNLYRYTSFRWRISGKREEVIRDNRRTIRLQEINYPGISKLLFPLQLWKPPKNSTESLQKKLLLLKFD
jgi:hypothetical protein